MSLLLHHSAFYLILTHSHSNQCIQLVDDLLYFLSYSHQMNTFPVHDIKAKLYLINSYYFKLAWVWDCFWPSNFLWLCCKFRVYLCSLSVLNVMTLDIKFLFYVYIQLLYLYVLIPAYKNSLSVLFSNTLLFWPQE